MLVFQLTEFNLLDDKRTMWHILDEADGKKCCAIRLYILPGDRGVHMSEWHTLQVGTEF